MTQTACLGAMFLCPAPWIWQFWELRAMDGLDSRVILPFCFLLEDRKEREGREKKRKRKSWHRLEHSNQWAVMRALIMKWKGKKSYFLNSADSQIQLDLSNYYTGAWSLKNASINLTRKVLPEWVRHGWIKGSKDSKESTHNLNEPCVSWWKDSRLIM